MGRIVQDVVTQELFGRLQGPGLNPEIFVMSSLPLRDIASCKVKLDTPMILPIALSNSLLASTPVKPWNLVLNGSSRSKIIVAPGATSSMKYGAAEIQNYVRQMTGATLKIVFPKAGSSGLGSHNIVLADDAAVARREHRSAMGDEEFRIQTSASGIKITGGSQRGVMYGCFAFLEDVLGVRWYNSRITSVPRRKTISVSPSDVHGKPSFEYREPYFDESFGKEWSVHNRLNGNAQRLDASVGGKVSYGRFVHTFNELVPPEVYFDKHPEYFSMVNGTRMKGYYQLCLTNPDVVKIAVAKVEEWIKENPEATIFSVSQNDTYANCQCPDCVAVEHEEGAPSGPLLRFVNSVAEAIGKKHPKVLIDTLAYQWSEKPPLKTKPRSNVRIRIALIGACFSHPLDGCQENSVPFSNLKQWAKVTGQIYVWHYTTNFANYLQPLPNLDEISGDIKLFKKYGVVGCFDEGGYAPGGGSELAGLKSYLLAKLMWNADRDPKEVIHDYVHGVYGPAAPYISKWIALIHASGRAQESHARIYDPPTAPYLSDSVLAEGTALFDKAERAAQLDPTALDEVGRLRLSLEYVQLMRAPAGSEAFKALAKTVADKVRTYGITSVREGEPVSQFLARIGQDH